eukprot:Pgem_evm1s18747
MHLSHNSDILDHGNMIPFSCIYKTSRNRTNTMSEGVRQNPNKLNPKFTQLPDLKSWRQSDDGLLLRSFKQEVQILDDHHDDDHNYVTRTKKIKLKCSLLLSMYHFGFYYVYIDALQLEFLCYGKKYVNGRSLMVIRYLSYKEYFMFEAALANGYNGNKDNNSITNRELVVKQHEGL